MIMTILFCHNLNAQTLLNPTDPASLCADVKPANLTYGQIMGINFKNYQQVPTGVNMDDISSFVRYFHLFNELLPNGNGGRDFGNSDPANYEPTVCPTAFSLPITSSTNCFDCPSDTMMRDMRARYCQAKQNGVTTIHAAIEKLQFGGDFFNKMFTSAEWGNNLAERFDNARNYGKKFAENYCPSDLTKACLVDILEIGNEPWGTPGPTDYPAVYRGLLQGINDYYTSTSPTINYTSSTTLNPAQMDTTAWRMKTSSGSYQFFQETPYWGTNDNVGVVPNDIWPYLEAVNIHPYGFKFNRNSNDEITQITGDLDRHPESRNGLYISILNAIKWRNENQATKQLISTEYGWDSQNVGFTAQAIYVVRAMLMAGRFKLNQAVLYEIFDESQDGSTGLYQTSGLIKVDGTTKKEAFYAVKRFKNLLGDKIFLDKLNTNDFQDVNSNNDYFAYVVGDSNRKPTHLVVWLPKNINNGSNLSSQSIIINNFPSDFSINTNTGSSSIKLNGTSGNDETVPTNSIVTIGSNSSVTIDASPIPYFIPLNPTSFTYLANSENPTITLCGNNSCQSQGGDSDGDGVCANEDCNDNDASVGASQPQYTPCDDGNANTSFDMIQADGCTCLGTDCGNGATQFTGCNVTVEVSGQDVRFVSTTETGALIIKVRRQNWSEQHDLCNDYNSGAECSISSMVTVNGTGAYVVDVQGGTGCSTFNITVGDSGGSTDVDNDSVCDLIDCDDNDPLVGAPQPENTPCDDGNLATTNDVILTDGCTCQGITGCQTDADSDGVCANEDCNDNDASVGASQPQYTPCDDGNANTSFDMIQADGCTCLGTDCGSGATQFTGCNVIVEVDGQDVRFVSTTETGALIIKVRRQNWSEQHDLCNDYNSGAECSISSMVTVNGTGAYVVDVQGGTGCSTFNITVGGSGSGTDVDNDSICDLIDCDDNDPQVGAPQPENTPCDDGNSATTNDVILADGCTCQGITGCQTDVDSDGVCANEDCNDNDASVGASQPQYTPCDDGNANTSFDMIQADGCTCLGTDCGSGATQFTGCNVTVEVDGQDVRFVSTTETGALIIKVRRQNWSEQHDLCNDYNSGAECSATSAVTVNGTGTYVVDVQGGTGCSTFNITVDGSGSGTDVDNDSICDLIDCDDNDASVGEPQPENTPCDDGNSGTTNDVILADGCTCQGLSNLISNTTSTTANDLIIYPNPAHNNIHIDLNEYAGIEGNVEIFNHLGQRQFSKDYVSIPVDPIRIDLSGFTSGIYFVVIQAGNMYKVVEQLVIIDRE